MLVSSTSTLDCRSWLSECKQGGSVPAVSVGAVSELLTGLGVWAPFSFGCCVGDLVVEMKG